MELAALSAILAALAAYALGLRNGRRESRRKAIDLLAKIERKRRGNDENRPHKSFT